MKFSEWRYESGTYKNEIGGVHMAKPDLESIKTLDPDAVFSVRETARYLGMTHNGVLTRMKKGLFKYGKCGSQYMIPGREIQKQIQLPQDTDV